MSRRFGMDSYQRREELELSGYCKPNGIRWGSKSSPGVGAAKTVRPVVLCCIWLSWTLPLGVMVSPPEGLQSRPQFAGLFRYQSVGESSLLPIPARAER